MPELPEVQTTVNGINKYTKGLFIKGVWTSYNSPYHTGKDNIKNPVYFKKFKRLVVGKHILIASRRGKNVLIHLSDDFTILVHMKMTGHFLYGTYKRNSKLKEGVSSWVAKEKVLRDDPFNRHIRLVFSLSNGKSLALSDMRKFAKVTLIPSKTLDESVHLRGHGPEPLLESFGFRELKETLSKRLSGKIKQVLMDPKIISGIGNIYSDEILWRIGIHPLEKPKNLSDKKIKEMLLAIKAILRKGIAFGGDSMSDYRNILGERGKFQENHMVYQKTGEKCLLSGCGGTIKKIKLGGRSAHFCDKHQKLLN